MSVPTVPLGFQGLKVSKQGLGCMGMSAFYGSDDEKESVATLERGAGARRHLVGQLPVLRQLGITDDELARLEENVGTLDVAFTDDELARLEPLSQQVVGARY